jgi:thiamine-phosphate pyrophosphorylase
MTSFTLYLITDPKLDPIERVRAALTGSPAGAIAVQARDRSASARSVFELASALAPICRAAGAPLLVNDRADVARAVGAGVHLPETGLAVEHARAILGPGVLIGRSCHDRAGLERATGADFATLGPIDRVEGKNEPMGVDGFARTIEGLSIDVYALGGVTAHNAGALIDRGARGVAVVRAVLGEDDPARAARWILDACRRA